MGVKHIKHHPTHEEKNQMINEAIEMGKTIASRRGLTLERYDIDGRITYDWVTRHGNTVNEYSFKDEASAYQYLYQYYRGWLSNEN